MSALAAGLGGRAPDAPGPGAAVRLVGTELGRLPAFVFGIRLGPSVGGPAHWSVQLGARRRRGPRVGGPDRDGWPRPFAGCCSSCVAGTVTAAAAFSVTRVRPPLIDYLVQWATVAGILVWISVGVVAAATGRVPSSGHAAVPCVAAGPWSRCARCWFRSSAFSSASPSARNAGLPPSDPNPRVLAAGVARWLPRPADGVSVEYGGTVTPVYLGTMAVGAGVVLELDKQGVPVRPPASAEFGFAPGAAGLEGQAAVDGGGRLGGQPRAAAARVRGSRAVGHAGGAGPAERLSMQLPAEALAQAASTATQRHDACPSRDV